MAPTKRRFQDPIAPQSSSLCYYMNNHPAVVLSFARYFGEYLDAESAKMIEVDHAGFLVTCQLKDGQEHEIRVAFDHPVHEVNQCKEMIMKLAKEAETALRGPDQTQQGAMPDSTFYWPDFDQGLFVVLFLLTLAYLEFVPYTKSPQLKWIIDTVGSTLIHQVSVLVFSIHFFEAIATLYFTLVVGGGTDFFTPTDIGMWMVTTLVFGVASLTKLVPLAYRAQAKAQQKRKE